MTGAQGTVYTQRLLVPFHPWVHLFPLPQLMSDIEPGLDHVADPALPVPVREGLPPRYKMRADAHYVEQLDTSLFSAPIRHLDVRSIDGAKRDGDDTLSAAFLESVRNHGILQPLLVRSRGGRFQVMSGSKRLAAAVEVGLQEVPCLVERLDDDQARALAVASNVPASVQPDAPLRQERPKPDLQLGAFAECLTAVASSAGLLSGGSALTQTVAIDLVRAEASRALHLLRAIRVLRGEVTPVRRTILPRTVLQRVVEQTESERRLRGLALAVDRDGSTCPPLSGDEDLLVASIGALVVGASVLLEAGSPRTVTLGAVVRNDGSVAFVAEHEGAELPLFWRSILAEDDTRETSVPGTGATSALALLRAARQVAGLHGGRMSVDCLDGSTNLSIVVPAAR